MKHATRAQHRLLDGVALDVLAPHANRQALRTWLEDRLRLSETDLQAGQLIHISVHWAAPAELEVDRRTPWLEITVKHLRGNVTVAATAVTLQGRQAAPVAEVPVFGGCDPEANRQLESQVMALFDSAWHGRDTEGRAALDRAWLWVAEAAAAEAVERARDLLEWADRHTVGALAEAAATVGTVGDLAQEWSGTVIDLATAADLTD